MKTIKIVLLMTLVLLITVPVSAGESNVSASAEAGAFAAILSPQQFPLNLPIYPNLLQQVPGHVGDATKEMPNFEGMLPLTNEKVRDVVVNYGWCLDRVRLEDVEIDLIKFWKKAYTEKGWSPEEMRYRVQYKMNFRAVGTGGGVTGGIVGVNGGSTQYGGTGSVGMLPGWASTLTDPPLYFEDLQGSKIR